MRLIINKTVPLGNGTREAGFILGQTSAKSLSEVAPENTVLGDDVTWDEIRNALLNPSLLGEATGEPVAGQVSPPPQAYWRETALASVDGVTDEQLAPLTSAGVTTFGQFVDFQEAGKTTEQPIDEATELKLLEALDRLVAAAK